MALVIQGNLLELLFQRKLIKKEIANGRTSRRQNKACLTWFRYHAQMGAEIEVGTMQRVSLRSRPFRKKILRWNFSFCYALACITLDRFGRKFLFRFIFYYFYQVNDTAMRLFHETLDEDHKRIADLVIKKMEKSYPPVIQATTPTGAVLSGG